MFCKSLMCFVSSLFIVVVMNIVSWNCRGVAHPNFLCHIKEMKRLYDISILAILEPRISDDKRRKVIQKMGFSEHFVVDVVGLKGGIWLLWDNGNWE